MNGARAMGGWADETFDASAAMAELIAAQMDVLFEPIGPGVEGLIARDDPGMFELAGIRALVEGSGDVGRYLDRLPMDRLVVVPYVTSERLQGMLARRGFREVRRWDPNVRDWGKVWVRKP